MWYESEIITLLVIGIMLITVMTLTAGTPDLLDAIIKNVGGVNCS